MRGEVHSSLKVFIQLQAEAALRIQTCGLGMCGAEPRARSAQMWVHVPDADH